MSSEEEDYLKKERTIKCNNRCGVGAEFFYFIAKFPPVFSLPSNRKNKSDDYKSRFSPPTCGMIKSNQITTHYFWNESCSPIFIGIIQVLFPVCSSFFFFFPFQFIVFSCYCQANKLSLIVWQQLYNNLQLYKSYFIIYSHIIYNL